MRYVVYGAGAVGGVVGGRMHLSGTQTTLVARGEHLRRIQEDALKLDTADGLLTVDAPAVEGSAAITWTDDTVVLLAVKSHQTQAALDDLVAHAPHDVPVVSLQNGVSNEREVLRRFPRVYGVCVMLPSTHLEPGVVVQKCHPTPGILDLGRIPDGTDEVTDAVAADLRTAGFESVPRPDILAWKYRKLVLNLGNGVDATCRPGEAADELVRRARDEAEQVLEAAGVQVVSAEEDLQRRGARLQPRSGEGIRRGGSTWQSVTRGTHGVEVDHLSGEIVLLGRWHGVATPVNELVQRTTHDLVRGGGPARSLDAEALLARLP